MEVLLEELDSILGILEQIDAITTNQTTVLLDETSEKREQEEELKILEQMVEYKEELIKEVEQAEDRFNKLYQDFRSEINNEEYIHLFKEKVNQILKMKNMIMKNEETNVIIMQSRVSRSRQVMSIPKSSKRVADLYKNSETH